MPTTPQVPQLPPADDGPYKEQAGDRAFVVRLGDCRLCQHRMKRSAELVLVQGFAELWEAIASGFNTAHPILSKTMPLTIPNPTVYYNRIMTKFGWSVLPDPEGVSSWIPEGWYWAGSGTLPGNTGPVDSPEMTIDQVAQTLLAGIVSKIEKWKRTKQQQADCCKDKVLRQLPGSRKNIWIPIHGGRLKKKVRTNPRRKKLPAIG